MPDVPAGIGLTVTIEPFGIATPLTVTVMIGVPVMLE